MSFLRFAPLAMLSGVLSAACSREAAPERAAGTQAARSAPDAAPEKPDAAAATEGAAPQPFHPTSRARLHAQGQLGPGPGTLVVHLEAPSGAELSEGAPLRLKARGAELSFPESVSTTLAVSDLPLRLPVVVSDGAWGPAELELTYYYCSKGESASCRPERAALTVDLDLDGTAPGGEAFLSYRPES